MMFTQSAENVAILLGDRCVPPSALTLQLLAHGTNVVRFEAAAAADVTHAQFERLPRVLLRLETRDCARLES